MAIYDALCIGASTARSTDAQDFFAPPKVPANYSKQTTIDKFIRETIENRQAVLAGGLLPMADVLTAVHVCDHDGTTMFSLQTPQAGKRGAVALPFVNWLLERLPTQFASALRLGDADPEAILVGFDIKEHLRIAAAEILYLNARSSDIEQHVLPIKLWKDPAGVYDPLDVFLDAAGQREFDLYSLLRYLKIEATKSELLTNPQHQAEVAAAMVRAGQFVPPYAVVNN